MMAEDRLYSLEFLFDGSQIDEDQLRKQSAKAIGLQRDSSVEMVTEKLTSTAGTSCLKLSIKGNWEKVDSCHQKLAKAQLVRRDFCILLLDEPGDEIRERAYPILARIETRLRTFVNRAMTEIIGFDWWENMVPEQVRERVEQVEGRAPSESLDRYHPLEHAYLDDLLLVVTGSVQHWAEGRPLSMADLQELLAECSSIQELREKLAMKTRKISLWDEVFTHYFQREEHKERWRDLQKTIQEEVVSRRHRVMHHRAMHRWELEKLEGIEQEVNALIGSAKSQLTEEERAQVRRTSREWLDVIQGAIPYAVAMTRSLERAMSPTLEMTRRLGGAMSPTLEMTRRLGEAMSPTLEMTRRLGEAMSPTLEMTRRLAEAMGPTLEMTRRLGEAMSPTLEMTRRIAELDHTAEMLERRAGQQAEIADLEESSAVYVGSTKSNRFHLSSCRYAQRLLPENRLHFASRNEAVSQRYSPCESCCP